MRDLYNRQVSRIKNYFFVFARNAETFDLVENFLIVSVFSILFTRVYLNLTGFPQIGGAGLHIAHMLWGGLLMLIANFVAVVFLNKEAKHLSVIIGGAGFGLFIDEIGKFITSDNNYFFEPTFAIIYLIFITLFFLLKTIAFHRSLTEKEYAVNALEEMKEVMYSDLDAEERNKALLYLQQSDQSNPFIVKLQELLLNCSPHTDTQDISLLTAIKYRIKEFYRRQIRKSVVTKLIAGTYIGISIVRFFVVLAGIESEFNFWEAGRQVSSAIVFLLILRGLNFHRRKMRLRAYTSYLKAVLVSILVVQIFDFYFDQLSALFFLIIGIVSYTTLQYVIGMEKEKTPAGV